MLSEKTSSFTFASVVVTAPIGPHGELTYRIPEARQTSLKPGMRVLVPVGRRKMTGIVSGVSTSQDAVDEKNLKDILDVLDETSVFSQDLMDLWQWTATYYLTSLGEMLITILPGGLRSESTRVVTLLKKSKVKGQKSKGTGTESANDQEVSGEQEAAPTLNVPKLSNAEQVLLDVVTEKKRITTKALGQRFPTFPVSKILLRLEALDLLKVREHLPQRRKAPEEDLVSPLSGAAADAPDGTNVSPFTLSESQGAACKHIISALQPSRFEVFLLHGVTGSGKTEVYVQAAQAALLSGKSVLMLVPEIALTHQLVARARQRFGSQVAVLHSGLRASERWAEWQRIARGEAPVIIGARSAIFAPITRLGLIIVDEEHDGAYKQEEGVRYNARDIAVVRGKISACPVVLGSATPSLESYVHSQSQRYTLLTLPERIASRPLPEVEVIDLRREARPSKSNDKLGNKSDNVGRIFSAALRQALEENYEAGMQSLLFMNRRGYANYLQCRLCGEVLVCQQCSVTLTWHLQDGRLQCHYCGFSCRAPERCAACSGTKLEGSGIGTEQVEEALKHLLPTVRVARLDRDSVRKRGALNEILAAWHNHDLDVLIGTQMVAKGHDVPGVTLVGVLLADLSLNFPDFRAAERTFQLLTQVAGRAGRGNDPGRVIVQTYSPQHYSIRAAVRHDFARFATQELRYRKQLGYPPFARAVNIRFEGTDGDKVSAYAEQFAEKLHAVIDAEHTATGSPGSEVLLGPAPAPIEKIKGRERWHLLLKGEQPRALHALIQQARQELFAHPVRGIRTIVDVDPYSML